MAVDEDRDNLCSSSGIGHHHSLCSRRDCFLSCLGRRRSDMCVSVRLDVTCYEPLIRIGIKVVFLGKGRY
jgi:hypothetical protein